MVRAGVAVEDELGVVFGRQRDDRHGRARFAVQPDAARLDTFAAHHVDEVMPQGVVAYLADERGRDAKPLRRHRDVSRRAARLGIERADIRQPPPDLGRKHVYEEVAEGD